MINKKETEHIEVTNCNNGEVEYFDRVYQYSLSRKYDTRINNIYHNYSITIDNTIYPLEKFYITFNDNMPKQNMHLMNVRNEYTDILTNSLEQYEYNNVVHFRDTTSFIELINCDGIQIDDNSKTIILNDKSKIKKIIDNWDGMIHDKVAETDAVKNKNMFNR